MKKLLSILCLACNVFFTNAQTWTEPSIPGEDLNSLSSSKTVYLYNVETDAFFINGMTWGTNACATRLTNGDTAASIPQQCSVTVSNGTVSISLKNYADKFLSCPSENANDVYVDQTNNQYFTYTETSTDSRIYTLENTTFGRNLDVTWKYGGHLTLVGGGGYTKWAFISETSITNSAYALYKAKKQLYNLYKAVCDACAETTYATELATAHSVYTSTSATVTSIRNAAKTLFNAVYSDIQGPINVSFLFNSADMVGVASVSNWTSENSAFGWGEFEKFHAPLSLSQSQNVPQGIYDIVFHGLYRQDGTDAAPILSAHASNTVTSEIPLMGSIDFQVGNTNSNDWTTGELYNQPNGMQSCGQALTHNDAVAYAHNVIMQTSGTMQIKIQMSSSSQWLNWQGVEIIYNGNKTTPLKEEIAVTIHDAEQLYGNGEGKGADNLKSVLDKAKAVWNDSNATMLAITDANIELKEAMEVYRKTSATVENPLDWTSLIANASFEKDLDDWNAENFNKQTNAAFGYKAGSAYIEKWVPKGKPVGNASVSQVISGLEMGVYVLKVAAQNIQEGSSAQQSNAWIVSNNKLTNVNSAKEYTVVFTNIEKDAVIGFKAENATGNWLACDNFRLYYAGGEDSDYQAELQAYINDAKSYLDKKMQTPVLEALKSSIQNGESALQNESTKNYPTYSTPIRLAKETAITSIAAFESLQKAIDTAIEKYGDGNLKGADKFLAVINEAKTVNDQLNSTIEQMQAEEEKLERAAFEYILDNATGITPKVTTDTRHVRGSSTALGRLTYSGVNETDLMEIGFCWSTQPNPTVLDNRSTSFFDLNGRIYRMDGLQPATVYYVRAYAMTKNYAVGYGDVIKIITLPKGQCTYWYNWGADADANKRIDAALADGIRYYNDFTSIKGFHVSCSFGSGTPTADCGYGGGMRVGPNASYQRTGTILHEMAHGIGVGTHSIWYGYSPLRETGYRGLWLGERANKVLQFFDNNTTSMMTGDGTHMWPYGINGAHEDYNNPIDYMINAMIVQGLGEDGLPPTGGFATPAYTLQSEEGIKYYIKNENADCGLTTAYLTETTTGTLKWVEKSASEVLGDDAYAWYVDFVPSTCYYRIKNVKSGKYFTYASNTIKTASKSTPSSTENFQLMGGRVRANVNESYAAQGFWIVVPHATLNPPCLQANTNGTTSVANFNIDNSATAQRWIFLSEDDLEKIESTSRGAYLEKANDLLKDIKQMLDVPHTQKTETADATLSETISDIENRLQSASTSAEFTTLIDEAKTAAKAFIGNASPLSVNAPFDITFFINNPSMDDNTGWNNVPTVNHSCGEFFETTFNLVQTISKAPAGTYKLTVQAFQRPGTYTVTYEDYINGTNNVNTILYIRTDQSLIKHIASEAEISKLHDEDITVGTPSVYIPNTMLSASAHFNEDKYNNEVVSALTNTSTLRFGLRCNEVNEGDWTIFDNFKLYFYGDIAKDIVTDITSPTVINKENKTYDVYNLQGIKVSESLEGLPKGIYIVNKKKILVR